MMQFIMNCLLIIIDISKNFEYNNVVEELNLIFTNIEDKIKNKVKSTYDIINDMPLEIITKPYKK